MAEAYTRFLELSALHQRIKENSTPSTPQLMLREVDQQLALASLNTEALEQPLLVSLMRAEQPHHVLPHLLVHLLALHHTVQQRHHLHHLVGQLHLEVAPCHDTLLLSPLFGGTPTRRATHHL
jgi:hypothetical protein